MLQLQSEVAPQVSLKCPLFCYFLEEGYCSVCRDEERTAGWCWPLLCAQCLGSSWVQVLVAVLLVLCLRKTPLPLLYLIVASPVGTLETNVESSKPGEAEWWWAQWSWKQAAGLTVVSLSLSGDNNLPSAAILWHFDVIYALSLSCYCPPYMRRLQYVCQAEGDGNMAQNTELLEL